MTVPNSEVLSTSTDPSWSSKIFFTTANPKPRPSLFAALTAGSNRVWRMPAGTPDPSSQIEFGIAPYSETISTVMLPFVVVASHAFSTELKKTLSSLPRVELPAHSPARNNPNRSLPQEVARPDSGQCPFYSLI
jgi:hypothetical protein